MAIPCLTPVVPMARTLFLLFLFLFLLLSPLVALAQAPHEAISYPRVLQLEGKTLKVHHPVISSWTDYAVMEGWIPVEVTLDGKDWVGAVRARAQSSVDLERRTVTLSKQEVVETRFSDPATPDEVKAFAGRAVRDRTQTVMLDEILMSLADDFEPPGEGRWDRDFNRQAPRIVVSEEPLQLLLIDQKPVQAPITGTSLKFVVNTDWSLFYDDFTRLYYVINDGVWQSNGLLATGGWNTESELPEDFNKLAIGDEWEAVRDALPPKTPAVEPPPFLISLEATELIVLDGAPRLQAIEGAGELRTVSNTEQDLFKLGQDWYFLAAGRWFTAQDLDGRWSYVDDLPQEFRNIPDDHGRAHVLRSVPGTVDNAVAYIEATMPQTNALPASARLAQDVAWVGEPRFELIPQTRVEKGVNTPFAVLRHNNFYYLAYEAAWYFSRTPTGPWQVATVVPEEIYAIPPSDPLHYVTYLRPSGNESVDGEARFSYTQGYNGMYTIGRRVVQGTGWSYTPWVAYPGGSPVYWGWPRTYGYPYRYPYYGRYGWHHPHYYYGAYFPPQTLEFSGSARAVGGSGGSPEASEQDPALARAGYDYTTLEQQRDAELRAQQNAANDLYVGPDGQVYRRSEQGWSQHNNGEWDTMAELQRQYGVQAPQAAMPEGQQRQAYRQNEDDIERMERYYDRRSKNYNIYSTIYVRQ